MAGPLNGVRIIEVVGQGPGPFCAMLLADMGADVIRIDRAQNVRDGAPVSPSDRVLGRGRRSIALDLKHPDAVATFLDLVEQADGLIEGFRPGVMERLGIGPDVCMARNPKLVFGRITGWGQDGPLAHAAGHDINYIALAGVLAHIGTADSGPVVPLNLVGDFGGGAMFLAYGIVCALFEASRSGAGQVVDAAMVDGASLLNAGLWGVRTTSWDENRRAANLLDGGAPFYATYECADGKYVAVGSIEPQFYDALLHATGLADDPLFVDRSTQMDKSTWPERSRALAAVFRTKTCADWCAIMEQTDACFSPVLTMGEAAEHPHNIARGTFIEVDGMPQPGPAPRFGRTTPTIARPPARVGEHTRAVLTDWGLSAARVDDLLNSGAARSAAPSSTPPT